MILYLFNQIGYMTLSVVNNRIINTEPLPKWSCGTVVKQPYVEGWHHLIAGFSSGIPEQKPNAYQRVLHVITGISLLIPLINIVIYATLRFFCPLLKGVEPAAKPLTKQDYLNKLDGLLKQTHEKIGEIEKYHPLPTDILNFIDDLHDSTRQVLTESTSLELAQDILENAEHEFRFILFQVEYIGEPDPALQEIQQRTPKEIEWSKKVRANRYNREAARTLIEEGNKLGLLNKKFILFLRGTSFHYFSASNRKEFIPLLIKYGVDLSSRDGFGNTGLIWSIANAGNEIAMEILKLGGSGSYLDEQCNRGNSALHLAVGKGYKTISADKERLKFSNLEIVQQLIALKSNVNLANNDGNTPLHLACLRRDSDMIKALLDTGAVRSIKNKKGELAEDLLKYDHPLAYKIIEQTVNAFLLSENEHEQGLKHSIELFSNRV